jgi:hypothetical protein
MVSHTSGEMYTPLPKRVRWEAVSLKPVEVIKTVVASEEQYTLL